jgi:hypothetical protein
MRCLPLLFVVAACGDNTAAAKDPFTIAPLVDTNPDPAIVEVSLVASVGTVDFVPGKPAEIWGYRDGSPDSKPSVPGPLLEANQGD